MTGLPEMLRQSTVSAYSSCGEQWRLEHLQGVPTQTWWATLAGSAVHCVTDAYECGLQVTFQEAFTSEIATIPPDTVIKASGRKLTEMAFAGGPNKKDHEWWLHWGQQYVDAYKRWREESDWQLLQSEYYWEEDLGPGGRVYGTMDRVFITEGMVVIVDLKTGAEPTSAVQLATYREGLFRATTLLAEWGYYLMFKWDGEKVIAYLGEAIDLTQYSTAFIENEFAMTRRGMEAGVFMPNTRNNCKNSCGVLEFCRAMGGKNALTIPVAEPRFGRFIAPM